MAIARIEEWVALTELTGRQHGVVGLRQLADVGISTRSVRVWVDRRRLVPVHTDVVAVAGHELTFRGAVMAAVLAAGPGAAASHLTAGHLWNLVPAVPDRVEVTVRYPRDPRPDGVVVHRSRDLVDDHLMRRERIPVTNPFRTLVDLGATVPHTWFVEDALDRALTARLVTCAGVERMRTELGRPGRSGAGVLGEVLDQRALAAQPPDGLLEPRMARLLRLHGLPPAVFQHAVVVDGRSFRIDFAYPEAMVAIEVLGYDPHGTSRQAFERDVERRTLLTAAGWVVLEFTWTDVVSRPETVARRIRPLVS